MLKEEYALTDCRFLTLCLWVQIFSIIFVKLYLVNILILKLVYSYISAKSKKDFLFTAYGRALQPQVEKNLLCPNWILTFLIPRFKNLLLQNQNVDVSIVGYSLFISCKLAITRCMFELLVAVDRCRFGTQSE